MNLKLQSVIEKFGLIAYGYYWACVELVGKEGDQYKVSGKKDWKIFFKKFLNIEIETQDTFLNFFAEKDLIDRRALEVGNLYIPKLEERCDEYTEKRKRLSRQAPDNVGLEQIRTDNNTTDKTSDFEEFWKRYPKKVAKAAAEKAWKKVRPDPELLKRILTALDTQKRSTQWLKDDGQYIPYPTTWLNQGRWNDVSVSRTVYKISDKPQEYFEKQPEKPISDERMKELTAKLAESKRI